MPTDYDIREDDLTLPGVIDLLQVHLVYTAEHSPAGSIHAIDPVALRGDAGLTFWGVWDGGVIAGCGALKELDPRHGEVKSMVTAKAYRRRGVATLMLAHLSGVALVRGYGRLSLETGIQAAYAPARALYARHGFAVCAPFADYKADTNSVFMSLDIASARHGG